MAALILPSRRGVQPQHPVEVDWSNPLTSGLVLDIGANTALRDVVSGRAPSWTAGAAEYTSNKYGRAVNFAADVVSFGDVEFFPSSTATFLIVDKPATLTQAAGLVNKRLSASSQHSFSIGYNYNSSSELCIDIGSATGSAVAISYRFSLSKFSTNGNIIAVVIDVSAGSGAKVRLFVNGVEETSKTVAIDTVLAAIPNTTAPFELGRVNNGAIYYTGHISKVAAWSRALSASECKAISADVWQLSSRSNRGIYFLPSDAGGGATAYSLTASHGIYTLTGQDAGLTYTAGAQSYSLTVDHGSYSLSGQDATLTYAPGSGAYSLIAEAGVYSLSGQDALTTVGRNLAVETGSYALSGQSAGLVFGRRMAADVGAYAFTGQDAALTFTGANAYSLTAEPGLYSIDGQDADISTTATAPSGGRGFTFQKWKPKLWWVRKPRSLDEEEAEEKLEAAAQAIAKVAAKQIKRIKPGQPVAVTKPQKAEVREAIAPLVADMPGFDWVGVYKAILERLAQEKAEQEREALRMAQIEIERIRQIDDEEVLMLLMEI